MSPRARRPPQPPDPDWPPGGRGGRRRGSVMAIAVGQVLDDLGIGLRATRGRDECSVLSAASQGRCRHRPARHRRQRRPPRRGRTHRRARRLAGQQPPVCGRREGPRGPPPKARRAPSPSVPTNAAAGLAHRWVFLIVAVRGGWSGCELVAAGQIRENERVPSRVANRSASRCSFESWVRLRSLMATVWFRSQRRSGRYWRCCCSARTRSCLLID